jgi:predicted secreted protein
MSTDGIIGFGTTITIGGASVGNLTSVNVGDFTRDDVDVSNSDSPNGWKESLPGMKDGGTLALEAIYTKTSVSALMALFEDDSPKPVVITLPDKSHFDCTGYLNSLGVSAPFDDKVTAKYQLKISGKPAFTPGAAS